ncbi:MAG TPA: DUF4112 domain-containing protein [Steroidobacteraceae bacterium]|nr:DUF4112 domain-containing protein [Steroidobacteraceae bacterium]
MTTYDHDDPSRPIPESRPDALALYHLLARLLDEAFRLPGTKWRFGLDPLLGLVPVVGDLLSAALGTFGVMLAGQLGAPPSLITRMLLNLLVDTVIGSVPFAGDLFDFGFKANTRNRLLLERWLAEPRRTQRTSRIVLILLVVGALAAIAGIVWLVAVGVAALIGLFR